METVHLKFRFGEDGSSVKEIDMPSVTTVGYATMRAVESLGHNPRDIRAGFLDINDHQNGELPHDDLIIEHANKDLLLIVSPKQD